MNEQHTVLRIDQTVIHQDVDGRYSLNDLHQAAGGEPRHHPRGWLEHPPTKALISELSRGDFESQPLSTLQTGDPARPLTYAVRELVYAYAMWVSPAFHLQVIRGLDVVSHDPVASGLARRLREIDAIQTRLDRLEQSAPVSVESDQPNIEKVRLNIDVDPAVRQHLKLLAVQEGRTIQAIVLDLIYAYFQRKEKQLD